MQLVSNIVITSQDPFCVKNYYVPDFQALESDSLIDDYIEQFQPYLVSAHEIYIANTECVGMNCFAVCETIDELQSEIYRLIELFENDVYQFACELVNLTPHDIVIENSVIGKLVIEPSGYVARVDIEQYESYHVNNISVSHQNLLNITNLPDPSLNTVYIVSARVVAMVKDRDDVVAPNTAQALRDSNNMIVSVPGFVK